MHPRLAMFAAGILACTPAGDGGSTTDPQTTTATSESTTSDPPTTSEPGSTGATGETGEPAAGCNMPDPGARADFTIDLGDVPGADEFDVDLELFCTVEAITVGSMIETDLSCADDLDVMHAVGFDIAASEAGSPAWELSETVSLQVRGTQDFGGLIEATGAGDLLVVEATLRREAGGSLLASVVQGPGTTADFHLPLTITHDREACGTDLPQDHPDFPGPDRDMALEFKIGETSLVLFSGQRGTLAAPGGPLAIDVGEATAIECCHGDWLVAISRLVK